MVEHLFESDPDPARGEGGGDILTLQSVRSMQAEVGSPSKLLKLVGQTRQTTKEVPVFAAFCNLVMYSDLKVI